MKALTRIATLALWALGLASGTAEAAQIWSEEFNHGTVPNPSVWSYDLGNWGWGNQELQNYTSSQENVRVEGGHLVITARQESNGTFTSGRIRTQDKLTLQYQYKQVDADTVAEKVVVDEAATSRDSAPPSAYKERHHLSARDLWHARKQAIPVRFSLRGGDVFIGLIEWFTRFEVKLNIGIRGERETASVIL